MIDRSSFAAIKISVSQIDSVLGVRLPFSFRSKWKHVLWEAGWFVDTLRVARRFASSWKGTKTNRGEPWNIPSLPTIQRCICFPFLHFRFALRRSCLHVWCTRLGTSGGISNLERNILTVPVESRIWREINIEKASSLPHLLLFISIFNDIFWIPNSNLSCSISKSEKVNKCISGTGQVNGRVALVSQSVDSSPHARKN